MEVAHLLGLEIGAEIHTEICCILEKEDKILRKTSRACDI